MTARRLYRETMDTGVELAQSARTIIRGGTALSSALGREAVKIDFNSELNLQVRLVRFNEICIERQENLQSRNPVLRKKIRIQALGLKLLASPF